MHTATASAVAPRDILLDVTPATPEAIAPFGTLIEMTEDGEPFGPRDAHLELGRGIPRFYVMKLHRRDAVFTHITRHLAVTQCLASVGGRAWFIALAHADAPDDPQGTPDPATIRAFHIAGDQALALHRSTWHAGPFFVGADTQGFFNLELADTNIVDHHTVDLHRTFGMRFRFDVPV